MRIAGIEKGDVTKCRLCGEMKPSARKYQKIDKECLAAQIKAAAVTRKERKAVLC